MPHEPGLTFHQILVSLPLDPAPLFGLVLFLGFFGVVGWVCAHSVSRRKGISREGRDPGGTQPIPSYEPGKAAQIPKAPGYRFIRRVDQNRILGHQRRKGPTPG